MFNYLPKKFQNLVLSLVLASSAIRLLIFLEDDVVYALVGDDRSTILNPDKYAFRYIFLLIVIAACALTLRKNAKNGENSLV